MIIGNLGQEPNLIKTDRGASVCTFSVATNRSWKPKGQSETKEATQWHDIVAFDKLADICAQTLQKGTKVYISGRLKTEDRRNQKGETFRKTEIVADQMIALDNRKNHQTDSSEKGSGKTSQKELKEKNGQKEKSK